MRLPGRVTARARPASGAWPGPRRLPPPAAAFLDVCCLLVFVAIGRATHHDGETVGGLASTAWPFLAGLALGWLVTRAWRQPAAVVPAGCGAWLGTVAFGMLLRVVAGQGTAVAFIAVALAFLGLFLLGWRAVAAVVVARGVARRDRAPRLAPRR